MRRGQVQKTLRRAEVYLKKGKREKALEDCMRVLAIDPGNEAARQMVERLQSSEAAEGDHLPEESEGTAAEEFEIRDVDAIMEAAMAHTRSKEYNRAIGELNRAVSLDPHRALVYWRRAKVYALQGAHGRAIKDFERAIALEPTDPEIYYQLAAYRASQGKYKEAITCFSKAIELRPDFFDAWLHRSMAYRDIEEYDKAEKDCRRALELRPDDVAAKMMARMLSRGGV